MRSLLRQSEVTRLPNARAILRRLAKFCALQCGKLSRRIVNLNGVATPELNDLPDQILLLRKNGGRQHLLRCIE
jgi:hypothetical protein